MMIKKRRISIQTAVMQMASVCARSEHCESEIREKLRQLGLGSLNSDEVLRQLVEDDFINNARYAKAFTNDKFRLGQWGRVKIQAALAAKGVSEADIKAALTGIDETEYRETLARLASTQAEGIDLEIYRDRAKVIRHLLSRGFESTLVIEAIAELRRERADAMYPEDEDDL